MSTEISLAENTALDTPAEPMPDEQPAVDTPPEPSPDEQQPRPRRGATTMEYLVMLSFILMAVILVVQGIGVMTGGLLQNSADATAKTNSP